MKVTMTEAICQEGLALLEGKADIFVAHDAHPHNYLDQLKDTDAFIVRVADKGAIDKETMESSDSLKVIGRTGIGYDSVDVESATKLGIPVEGQAVLFADDRLPAVLRTFPCSLQHWPEEGIVHISTVPVQQEQVLIRILHAVAPIHDLVRDKMLIQARKDDPYQRARQENPNHPPFHYTMSPSSKGSPHSGQNLGGCCGSAGSQPHLSQM